MAAGEMIVDMRDETEARPHTTEQHALQKDIGEMHMLCRRRNGIYIYLWREAAVVNQVTVLGMEASVMKLLRYLIKSGLFARIWTLKYQNFLRTSRGR